jgi:uncharacterized YigZ family protein
MRETDAYMTIAGPGTSQIKIKGSKFIGHAVPVKNGDEAAEFIAKINKQFYDATHNCTAYKIGVDKTVEFRYNDNGEPGGTAGLPMYQAIENRNMTDVAVVVTRYFGGTKLGKGGLVRAYSESAAATLDAAPALKIYIYNEFELQFAYTRMGEISHFIESLDGKIRESNFTTDVNLRVAVRHSRCADFQTRLIELTQSRIQITPRGDVHLPAGQK